MSKTDQLHLDADVVTLTSQLVDVPSESFQEGHLADLVEQALRRYSHLHVHRIGDNVVARTEGSLGRRVLLAGHLDTVPAADNAHAQIVAAGQPVPRIGLDHAEVAPQERLYGLGACDMKGGVAVALHIAATLEQPDRDLTYVLYAREEVAAVHSGLAEVIAERAELLTDAEMAILLEPSNAGVEAGCQGTLRADISVPGRRAHSARSWLGRNAIHDTADVLNLLAQYQPREVEVDGLIYREGLNAVGIRGGVAGNVIPDECVVTVNYRFAPDLTVDQASAHLREVFGEMHLDIVDASPGAAPGITRPAVAEFISRAGVIPRPKYGWTDVARFTELGIPALNFGPGDPGLAHTREEYVPTEQIRSVADVLRGWLE